MDLYQAFETSPKHETEGVWVDYDEHTSFLVARAGGANKKYLAAMTRLGKVHRKRIENELLDEGQAQKMLVEVYADTIILDWKGVKNRNGEELPFNRENVITVLTELPVLFNDLRDMSERIALYRDKVIEQDAKNS